MGYVDLATVHIPGTGGVAPAAWGLQIRENQEFGIDPPACSAFSSAAQTVNDATTTTLNAAYRMQATRRRVSDKVTLVADGQTGMGISGEFFIENIRHRFTDGGKRWEVTWELSPA